MCLNSGQKDKWLKQQAALATDMLLISQGNIENSRSKERGGRAHTLGDGLPGTISKQLTLGMSGSCCKTSKVIVTRESVNLESLDVGDEEGRVGKLLVLPGEPQLVTAIPRQGVQVGEEDGLLHVLPEE